MRAGQHDGGHAQSYRLENSHFEYRSGAGCTLKRLQWPRRPSICFPQAGNFWNTLGGSYYRIRRLERFDYGPRNQWISAVAETPMIGSFLAMAYWQLGNKESAHRWYKFARLWTAKYPTREEELFRFRAEVATLMNLPETEPANDSDDLDWPKH
jgi:hypothetical protein